MSRRINHDTLEKLKQWEGLRLEAYRDIGGVWTIGYGHTGPDVHEGLVITAKRAELLLLADLERFERAVDQGVTVPLTDNQFGALVSFAFNVGVSAFLGSTLRKRLNAGDYEAVPGQLVRWNKVGKKVSKGLTARRAAEAGLWARGSFVESQYVEPDEPRADNSEIKTVTTAGVGGASLTAIGETASKLEPLAEYSTSIRIVFVILALAAVVAPLRLAYRRSRT